MTTAKQAAQEWRDLAAEARRMADWDASQGISDGTVGYNKAAMYEQTAKALDLEATTGRPHCSCCLQPRGSCRVKPHR